MRPTGVKASKLREVSGDERMMGKSREERRACLSLSTLSRSSPDLPHLFLPPLFLPQSGRTPGTVTGLPGNTYVHLTLASPDVAALVRRHGRRGLAARQVDLRVRVAEGGGGSGGSGAPFVAAEGAALAAVAEGRNASTTLTAATPLTVRALPHQIHINAVSGDVENVNFLALPAGKAVTASVPVCVVGADLAPGVKRGGFLNLIRRAVRVAAPDRDALPAAVEVDASGLELGQRVACRDLALPPGAALAEPHPELPVLKVAGRQARD